VEENWEEKEFAKGLLGMSPEVEWETREGLRRRPTSLSQQVLFFLHEWRKSSVVLTLCQGTTSKERGVTRISPSNPRSRGENSAGTLPKFRKRETLEGGLLRNRGGENGVLTRSRRRELPGSAMEAFFFKGLSSPENHLSDHIRV
jgi:hypothetical protein